MSATGISAFESTIHATNVWLNEVMERLGWHDRHRAYRALRVVLHALRDRLSVEAAAALGAQLPMLVRGFYFEGWHPHGKPLKQRKKEVFLAAVADALRGEPDIDAEEITRAVCHVLAMHVSRGEAENVEAMLPKELRVFFSPETHSLWT